MRRGVFEVCLLGAACSVVACEGLLGLEGAAFRPEVSGAGGGGAGLSISATTGTGGTAPILLGNTLWADRYGDGAQQRATSARFDALGRVVVGGVLDGGITFAGESQVNEAGPPDFLLMSLAGKDGAPRFGFNLGNEVAFDGRLTTVGTDILLVGRYGGTGITFPTIIGTAALPPPPMAPSDAYVAKFDDDGDYRWSFTIGGDGADRGRAVAGLEGADVAVTVGAYEGSVQLGSTVHGGGGASAGSGGGTPAADSYVAGVTQIGPSAPTVVWSSVVEGTGTIEGRDVVIDDQGEVAFTLLHRTTEDDPEGPGEILIKRYNYNPGGVTPGWSDATVVMSGSLDPGWMARDGAGGLLVGSAFAGTATVGSETVDAGSGRAVLLARLEEDTGAVDWVTAYPSQAVATLGCIASNGGFTVIAGSFETAITLGTDTLLTAPGGVHAYVAKLDATGEVRWAHSWGDDDPTTATVARACDIEPGEGAVVVAGSLTGSATLTAAFDAPDIELNSAGNEDWFVAKLQK